jgi:protein SCO1/2
VGLWQIIQRSQQAPLASLIVLPEPREISDFSLTDQSGRPFTQQNFRGAWTLVFFGFTHCPDVCPSTLYDLQQVNQKLDEGGLVGATPHRVLFVSVDPERDTPGRLREYLEFFDPSFIGVTGNHAALEPFSRQMSIAYRIEDHEPGTAVYNVDHSASILLVAPSGRLYGVFPAPHDAAMIAQDMASVIQ